MTSQFRLWKEVKHSFTTWQDRSYVPMDLMNLSDRTLRDIGLCRHNKRPHPPLPFWIGGL